MAVSDDPASPAPVIDLTKPMAPSTPDSGPRPPGEPVAPAGSVLVGERVGLVAHDEVSVVEGQEVSVEERRPVLEEPGRVFDQEAVVAAAAVPREKRRPAPYSIWRRMAAAEARQIELDLSEAEAGGNPYPDDTHYDYQGYLVGIRLELDLARSAAANAWPPGRVKRMGRAFDEMLRVWTGSEHETAFAALHRASGLLLMVLPDACVRSEALKLESIFKDTKDIPAGDPRHQALTTLFDRIDATGAPRATRGRRDVIPEPHCLDLADRGMLRELRRTQNESWEIARSRIRIFRNILSGTIPLLTIVLVAVALLTWTNPSLISLRPSTASPQAADVALVEFLGAFGGLLSAVASVRALRNFQRFYGLPLAQTILKLPAGAATALAGTILLQRGLLGIAPVDWDKVIPYALAFGIAQIAATRQIDSRASDLLGDANAKSPATTQTTSASVTSGDIP